MSNTKMLLRACRRGMLKSCARPEKALIGICIPFVARTFVCRHEITRKQPGQLLRYKSSSAQRSKRGPSNKPVTKATETPSASQPKSNPHETPKRTTPEVYNTKPNPNSSSQAYSLPTTGHEDNNVYRPIVTDPVKPTSAQDLSSTRPAELETVCGPGRTEDGNVPITTRVNYFYRLGKSYLTFYKTGLKNIWNNRKEYREVKARLGSYTFEHAALYGGQRVVNEHGSETGRVPTITRREYQLCLRTKHDLGKLIPFGIVFAICGEFTPLVILALGSSVVPLTCRIPQQVQNDRRWFLKRLNNAPLKRQLEGEHRGSQSPQHGNALAFLHGVSSVAELPPVFGRLFYQLWVRPRLIRKAWEVLADTTLIRREGGFRVLEPIEVLEYANEFFCPEFIWRNNRELQLTGMIAWDSKMAHKLSSILERNASVMLAHDWRHVPEQERFQYSVIYEGGTLFAYEEMQKEYERTGRIPL